MQEKKKNSRAVPTVTTVKAHYVGTESMSAVFERVFISLYQSRKLPETLRESDK